jgi:hypothetical protein
MDWFYSALRRSLSAARSQALVHHSILDKMYGNVIITASPMSRLVVIGHCYFYLQHNPMMSKYYCYCCCILLFLLYYTNCCTHTKFVIKSFWHKLTHLQATQLRILSCLDTVLLCLLNNNNAI